MGFQEAPTPRGSAMGLMEQILHTTDADEKALLEDQITPEEAEFQEWCAKLAKFFDTLFFPAAKEYKQVENQELWLGWTRVYVFY